jgi:hypothetical protein
LRFLLLLCHASKEEIIDNNKNIQYYLDADPNLFRLEFTEEELENALISLIKARLVTPYVGFHTKVPRYIVADEALRDFIHDVWTILDMKQRILFLKFNVEELNEEDKAWLTSLHGDQKITEYILRSWKSQNEIYKNTHDYNAKNVHEFANILKKSVEQRISLLNDKYSKIFEEYNFPVHIIKEIIK